MDILNDRLKPHPEAMFSKVGDEAVILHLVNATYYGLDPTGVLIWEGLNGGILPLVICEQIALECDVGLATVEDDTRLFLEDLLAHELLVNDPIS